MSCLRQYFGRTDVRTPVLYRPLPKNGGTGVFERFHPDSIIAVSLLHTFKLDLISSRIESTELMSAKADELCFTAKLVAIDPPNETPMRKTDDFCTEIKTRNAHQRSTNLKNKTKQKKLNEKSTAETLNPNTHRCAIFKRSSEKIVASYSVGRLVGRYAIYDGQKCFNKFYPFRPARPV